MPCGRVGGIGGVMCDICFLYMERILSGGHAFYQAQFSTSSTSKFFSYLVFLPAARRLGHRLVSVKNNKKVSFAFWFIEASLFAWF